MRAHRRLTAQARRRDGLCACAWVAAICRSVRRGLGLLVRVGVVLCSAAAGCGSVRALLRLTFCFHRYSRHPKTSTPRHSIALGSDQPFGLGGCILGGRESHLSFARVVSGPWCPTPSGAYTRWQLCAMVARRINSGKRSFGRVFLSIRGVFHPRRRRRGAARTEGKPRLDRSLFHEVVMLRLAQSLLSLPWMRYSACIGIHCRVIP